MNRKMKKTIGCGAFAAMTMVSIAVNAWESGGNKTVLSVGSHIPNIGFVSFVGGAVHVGCPNAFMYFDISTPLGKSMLNVLLMAKATGDAVSVGYALPATSAIAGACGLEFVALQ